VEGRPWHDALGLLTDAAFSRYSSFDEPDELVPESPDDVELLDTIGTREVYQSLGATHHGRTFHESVTRESVAALLPKRAGLHLYAEALHLATPQARYRDVWRILESAFAASDQALLARFPPLADINVTLDEVKELHVYRGRASHAQSRSGVSELRHIGHSPPNAKDVSSALSSACWLPRPIGDRVQPWSPNSPVCAPGSAHLIAADGRLVAGLVLLVRYASPFGASTGQLRMRYGLRRARVARPI
jgi:hypothetical protein